MSELDIDGSQWELSKENIQPIKQGRKASVLTTALTESQHKKLTMEKQEFEKELRSYTGSDPLDVWYRYVLWIEQNYPKGGTEGNLMKLIESCFATLGSSGSCEVKYRNDERFLDIWIKYINLCPHPLEVYATLNAKNMFTELSAFFENWAWEMEKSDNLKKANMIFLDGINRKAKPIDLLEMSYSKFQARVARLTLEEMNEPENAEDDLQRKALAALRAKGPKAKVANERVAAVVGPAGKMASVAPKVNAAGPKFKIFQDENETGDNFLLPASNPAPGFAPSHHASTKENVRAASAWSKNKMQQKTTVSVPVENVDSYKKPSFSVHADAVDNSAAATPAKPTDFGGVLSARKKEKEDWHVPLFLPEPFNPMAQPQYCKQLVYCGAEEFSFEELHALAVKKEEQKKKEQEGHIMKDELKALREMLEQQQGIISSLLEKKGKSPVQEAPGVPVPMASQTKSNPSISVTGGDPTNLRARQRPKAPPPQAPPPASRQIYEDSWVAINKSVSFAANATHNASHVNDVNSTRNLLSLEPVLPKPREELLSPSSFKSGMTPVSPLSGNSSSKETLHSPTVNTKFANNLVAALFERSLFHQSMATGDAASKPPSPLPIYQDENAEPLAPFPIYQDDAPPSSDNPTDSPPPPISPPAPGLPAFQIYSDEPEPKPSLPRPAFAIYADGEDSPKKAAFDENGENRPPSGYQQCREKRVLAGILKPSRDIPFVPLEDQLKMMDQSPVKDFDGIEPLNASCVPDDFTIKIPTNPEAFAKSSFVASTPHPWSFGLVPQVSQDGEDFTMAVPVKSNRLNALPEETSEPKESLKPLSHPGAPTLDNDSGDFMPPPPTQVTCQTQPSNNHTRPHLSPILEASRECRSSSSGSSTGGCTTLGVLSNYHGLTHTSHMTTSNASKSINFSQSKGAFSVCVGEISKSGYFADSSRGESLNDLAAKKSSMSKMNAERMDNSFDPDKIAAMLMNLDDETEPVKIYEDAKLEEENSLKRVPDVGDIQDFPLSRAIAFPPSIDPFCEVLQRKMLDALREPLERRGGFVPLKGKLPQIKAKSQISLGKEMYHVKRLRGSGAYAQIFHASTIDPMNVTFMPSDNDEEEEDEDEESQMILKVQKPACFWEFYICHELRERLKQQFTPESLLNAFMRINRGYYFPQGSILISQYHKYGTLLDVVNGYKKSGKTLSQNLIFYLMAEVTESLLSLHSCQIIHGDFKPDNVLLVAPPNPELKERPMCIKVIDFGRSIDMRMFAKGTSFTRKVSTDGFTCCEMREGLPWTFQTDLFGLAGVAHCMLWGTYMNVRKEAGTWKLTGVNYHRYMKKDFWQNFFHKMLNVPSCSEIPDLQQVLQEFKDAFDVYKNFEDDVNTLKNVLAQNRS